MLANLPIEVILSISRLLNFRDKLNLNATCKKLNDIISKTNLYEELEFHDDDSDNDAEEVIKGFEMERSKAAQVKALGYSLEAVSGATYSRLAHIFPNVTRFSAQYDGHYPDYKEEPILEPVATWVNTIEELYVPGDWYLLWLALECHTFPRLTVLEIEEEHDDEFFHILEDGFKAPHLLPYLKNAPALKQLNIRNMDISLNFLEEMHRSCPSMKSLKFDRNVFVIDNDALPEPIVPADSVLYLEITTTIFIDKNGLLLDYILKKYPNLRHLGFSVVSNEDSLVKRLNIYFNDEIDNRLTRNEYERLLLGFRSALGIYQNSAPAFFSKLPKTINSLKIKTSLFNNIANILSESDMKLVELNTEIGNWSYETDTEPIQLARINNLTSLKTLQTRLNQPLHVANHDVISTSITKLIIHHSESGLRIDCLLSAFPALERLSINSSKIILVDDNSCANSRRINPNLRTIRMHYVTIQPGVFEYIKLVAPNVKQLMLFNIMVPDPAVEKETCYLDLSGWNLRKCDLDIFSRRRLPAYRDCNITIENVTRRFIFPMKEKSVIYPGRSFSRKDKEKTMFLNIKCDNIEDFRLYTLRVKKINDEIAILA